MGKDIVYEEQGINPQNVANVNPYTGQLWDQLQGLTNQGTETHIGTMEGLSPQIQNIAQGLTGTYGQQAMDTADLMSQRAVQNVASQFSGQNALNSGAALSAMTRGAAEPISQAMTNIRGMESQLGGNLMGNLQQNLQDTYGTSLNMQGLLGAAEYLMPSLVGKEKGKRD